MGNLNSFSKGCRTCLQRRIKCDKRHPHCQRCEKGRIKCQGYNDTTFVDAKEQVLKLYKNGSKAHSNSSMSIISNARGASSDPDATQLGSATYCRRSAYLTDVSLPALQRIPSSPLTDEMYIAYTIEKLAKGPMTIICHDVFFRDRSGLRTNESVMPQCLSTMAQVYYGYQRNDSRVLSNGIRSYGRVLSKLSSVLSNDDCRVTSDIIVSALALSLVETILPVSRSSWITHMLGLESLFASRGTVAAAEMTDRDQIILDWCRPLMILAAFFTRRPSLMNEPVFKQTVHPYDSGGALDLSFLMSVLAELPAVFLQCDACVGATTKKPFVSQSIDVTMIWAKVRDLQEGLRAWKDGWNQAVDPKLWEVIPFLGVDSSKAKDVTWTTVFHFSNTAAAIAHTMYHTSVILLTSVSLSLLSAGLLDNRPSLLAEDDYKASDMTEALLLETRTSIQSIYRSTEYYLHHLLPGQTPADFYLFFPIHVARRASIKLAFSSELVYMTEAFESMKKKFPKGMWVNNSCVNRFNGNEEGLFG